MKTSLRSMLKILALLALALGVLGNPQPAHATVTIYFAAPAAAGTEDCSSFADACTLQTALGGAASGDQVWVKAGVYLPGALQSDTFAVPSGVSVYGGFAGTEGPSDFGLRNPVANLTVLSGDLEGNDTNKVNGVTPTGADIVGANSYHVVVMDGTTTDVTSATVLDGFTITAGQANGAGTNQSGGGMFCNGGGAGSVCSPTLENLVFSGNYATFGWGPHEQGISGGESSPVLTNVTFVGNQSVSNAGAMFNYGYVGTSSPTLTDVTFRNNSTGSNGGGMFNYGDSGGVSSPTLKNVTFEGNHANDAGGAMYNTASAAGTVVPSISNSTFYDNDASGGGAVFNFANGASSLTNPTFTNVTFNLNSATIDGGAINNAAIFSGSVTPVLENVILWGDTAVVDGDEINDDGPISSVDYSIVQGGAGGISGSAAFGTGTGNLATDPLLAPLKDNGGSTQTMALVTGSSAIDTGDNATCAAAPVSNMDQREQDAPGGRQLRRHRDVRHRRVRVHGSFVCRCARARQGVDGTVGRDVLLQRHHHGLRCRPSDLLPGECCHPRRDGGLHLPRQARSKLCAACGHPHVLRHARGGQGVDGALGGPVVRGRHHLRLRRRADHSARRTR